MLHSRFHRDKRIKVNIPVRLRGDGPDRDGVILDVSAKGMLCSCAEPPARGAYLELLTGNQALVGHVKWTSNNGRFGLVLQERLDIAAFEAGGPLQVTSARQAALAAGPRPVGGPASFGRAAPRAAAAQEIEIPTTSAEDDKRAKLVVVVGVLVVAALVAIAKLALGLF